MNTRSLFLIFALLIVFCQIAPAIAATASQKGIDTEKITEVQLEKRTLSKEQFSIEDFTLESSGAVRVKSKDISLYTERISSGIKISSNVLDYVPIREYEYTIDVGEIQKFDRALTDTEMTNLYNAEDSHDILIPVADIQNFNGHSVRITHFTDDGIQDHEYIQEVSVQDGYIVLPDVEFSSIIVDGATGYKSSTAYDVNVTDYTFYASETADRLDLTFGGVDNGFLVADGYLPEGAIYASTFNGSSDNLVDNDIFAFDNNVTYENGTLVLNGIDSNIKLTMSDTSQNLTSSSLFIIFDDDTGHIGSDRYIWDGGYWNADYGDRVSLGADSDHVAIYCRNQTGAFTSEGIFYTTQRVFTGYTWDGANLNYYLNNDDVYKTEPFYGLLYANAYNNTIGSRYSDSGYANVRIDFIGKFNTALNETGVRWVETGYSGTSIKYGNGQWQPVINGTISIENVTAGTPIYILSTNDTTASYFTETYTTTEDTTLEYETEEDGVVSFAINFTPSQNYSSTLLNWTPSTNNFTHNLSFTSTDMNATAITHDQIVRITTGALLADVNYWFNGTLSSLESFNYTRNIISKTATKVVIEYNSTNSNVENDFYLEDMSASSTFDFKYSNGTILVNATSDSNGYLKFDDVGGVTDSYKLINDTYTIEKQSSTVSFVAVVFTGLSFVGLYFVNRFRRR